MAAAEWQRRADELAGASLSAGDPTGWFDTLWSQGRSGEVTMPWDSGRPHPLLASWSGPDLALDSRRAVVVGCGLGADAEYVAGLGFRTLGFDVSPTAIELARRRHPGTAVQYEPGDLFDLPSEWRQAFDLVVDIYTVQALPRTVRDPAIGAVADLIAPGGTLLIVMAALAAGDDPDEGPPWPLTRDEIVSFAGHDLETVAVDALPNPSRPGATWWRAEFRRPVAQATGSA